MKKKTFAENKSLISNYFGDSTNFYTSDEINKKDLIKMKKVLEADGEFKDRWIRSYPHPNYPWINFHGATENFNFGLKIQTSQTLASELYKKNPCDAKEISQKEFWDFIEEKGLILNCLLTPRTKRAYEILVENFI